MADKDLIGRAVPGGPGAPQPAAGIGGQRRRPGRLPNGRERRWLGPATRVLRGCAGRPAAHDARAGRGLLPASGHCCQTAQSRPSRSTAACGARMAPAAAWTTSGRPLSTAATRRHPLSRRSAQTTAGVARRGSAARAGPSRTCWLLASSRPIGAAESSRRASESVNRVSAERRRQSVRVRPGRKGHSWRA